MPYGPSRGYSPGMSGRAAISAAKRAPVIPGTNMRRPTGRQASPTRGQGQQRHGNREDVGPSLGTGVPRGGGLPFNPVQPGKFEQHQMGEGTAPGTAAGELTPHIANEDQTEWDIGDLLQQNPRDTAEDEALIRELMQSQSGQGQADALAGLAAGGFGRSGAAAATLGDIRTRAARQAAGDILDVRQSARDEQLERLKLGLQSEFQDRSMDMTEAQWDEFMKAWEAQMDEDEQPPGFESGTAPVGTESEGAATGGEGSIFGFHPASGDYQVNPEEIAGAEETGIAPAVGAYIGSDAEWNYYRDYDGSIKKVKR